jgi:hypothetical protein
VCLRLCRPSLCWRRGRHSRSRCGATRRRPGPPVPAGSSSACGFASRT